jgi:hypothetical protein
LNGLYDEFLKIAGKITESFGVTPLLYGSLGLQRRLQIDLCPGDVDILLPSAMLDEHWPDLVAWMRHESYALQDAHEHSFVQGRAHIAFASNDLGGYAGIEPGCIPMVEDLGVCYLLPTLRQYLAIYEKSLTDSYRREKNNGKDADKIELIRRALAKCGQNME